MKIKIHKLKQITLFKVQISKGRKNRFHKNQKTINGPTRTLSWHGTTHNFYARRFTPVSAHVWISWCLCAPKVTLNVGRGKKTHKTELSTKASPFRSAVKKENFQTMEKIRSDFRGLE